MRSCCAITYRNPSIASCDTSLLLHYYISKSLDYLFMPLQICACNFGVCSYVSPFMKRSVWIREVLNWGLRKFGGYPCMFVWTTSFFPFAPIFFHFNHFSYYCTNFQRWFGVWRCWKFCKHWISMRSPKQLSYGRVISRTLLFDGNSRSRLIGLREWKVFRKCANKLNISHQAGFFQRINVSVFHRFQNRSIW